MIARQAAEALGRDFSAVGIVEQGRDGQVGLARGHGRGQDDRVEALGRQQGRWQDVALAQQVGDLGDTRVGLEVAALDVDVGDARAAVAGDHLVARPHDMLAGLQLDLLRPGRLGQQLSGVEGIGREGRDLPIQPSDRLAAHEVEAEAAGRDRRRMAVLDPEQDPLVGARRRQAGVVVGGPGVGVVGAGQHRRLVAVGVERVLYHVVAGDAGDVEEELAGEGAQAETPAHLGAVDHDRRARARQAVLPLRERGPGLVEQAAPQRRLGGAVARPVVGRHDAGVGALGVAEEGEVGREVEAAQIVARPGQHGLGQAQRIEAEDLGTGRQEVLDVGDQALGVEGRHQNPRRAGLGQGGHRLRGLAEQALVQVVEVLDEVAGETQRSEIVELREVGRVAERVVDRNRARLRQLGEEVRRLARGQRVANRLEEGVAAPGVAEGFDAERHGARCPRRDGGETA